MSSAENITILCSIFMQKKM